MCELYTAQLLVVPTIEVGVEVLYFGVFEFFLFFHAKLGTIKNHRNEMGR